MVGASREMVSRVMRDLENQGFIETREDGSIVVNERRTVPR
jgi:DNA-binding transcriptional regulator YhcF (GntR family)